MSRREEIDTLYDSFDAEIADELDDFSLAAETHEITRSVFISTFASMMKREKMLRHPETESFYTETPRHSYGLQVVKNKLALHNATKYGEAVNGVKASDNGLQSFSESDNIEAGARIAKVGKGVLTIVLVDNEIKDPGSPKSVIGYIQPEYAWVTKMYEGNPITEVCMPSIGEGPKISREIEITDNNRLFLKLQLVRFAMNTFTQDLHSDTEVIVRPNLAELDDFALYLYLEQANSKVSYNLNTKPNEASFYGFNAGAAQEALDFIPKLHQLQRKSN